MRKSIVLLVVLALLTMTANHCRAASVGTWNAYMSYHNITSVEKAGNIYYVLASENLYAYNTNDQSVQTYDKMNFLSDCGIQQIKWNPTSKRLVIIYSNQNIDLLDRNDNVFNVSDYYHKSMTEDKTINHVYIYNQYAYICTGFGILKPSRKQTDSTLLTFPTTCWIRTTGSVKETIPTRPSRLTKNCLKPSAMPIRAVRCTIISAS